MQDSKAAIVAKRPDPTKPTTTTQNSLSDVQLQVIASLARGRTISAAAVEAGIHRSTIHQWKNSNLDFTYALQSAQDEYRSQLKDYMKEISGVALETVRGFL